MQLHILVYMNEPDQIDTESAADAPRTYNSDHAGLREAAADVRQRREDEASREPSDERKADAEHRLKKAWGDTKGLRPDDIDLNAVEITKGGPLSAREGAKALAQYRATNKAALAEIYGLQETEAEADRLVAEAEAEVQRAE